MTRKYVILTLVLLAVLLTGCTVQTVDDMYAPPKRSEEYSNLQSAIDRSMAGLAYCAPLSGDHQQTVQLADLDGDGEEEYLLFAKGNEDRPLRILIFRKYNGEYSLMNTIESNGTAFEQVEYVQMDGNGGVEIVIGYQINDQVLRAVNVYTFKRGQTEQLFSSNYTKFLTVDMDADSNSELFILRPGPSDESNGIAEIYGVANGVVERSNEVQMSQPAKMLKRMICGNLYGGKTAVFAASTLGETEIVTDVYTVNEGRLTNVTLSNDSGTSMQTIRNYYVYADDIDNDGVVELPDLITMIHRNESGLAEKQDLIRWYAMKANGDEVDKLYTYHNFIGGWYLQLERRWVQVLTVQNLGNSYEFGLWNEQNGTVDKIFVVHILTGEDREEQSVQGNRFVLCRTDTVIYAAELMVEATDYGVTQDSLISSFHLIRQEWKTGET